VIVQSGLEWTVSGLLLGIGILFFLGALAASMFHLPWNWNCSPVPSGLPAMALPAAQAQSAPGLLERQIPEALDLISRALRAGAFSAGLQMAGEGCPSP
jgi:tight adherence protein B